MLNLEQEIVVASVESRHCYLCCGDHITGGFYKKTALRHM